MANIILHIDFNAFFCSVAEIYNPALRNTAFAIGRENSNYGVISTASYKAREYGIHSGMPLALAFKKLKTLNVISLPYSYYLNYHNKFINLLKEYTNLIEVGSIDEAYVDITELAKAKMASDLQKPLGLTVIRNKDIKNKLYGLSVRDIFGIGKKTYPKIEEKGILTIADFLNPANKPLVTEIISEDYYLEIVNKFQGKSNNKINPLHKEDNLSISTMNTYDRRLNSEQEIEEELLILTRNVYKRLVKDNYVTKTISITLRNIEFKTITRSKTIEYTDDLKVISDEVIELFRQNYKNDTLRLIGVGLANLIKKNLLIKEEYNLFTALNNDEKKEVISDLIKDFGDKYGKKALYYGKYKTLFN